MDATFSGDLVNFSESTFAVFAFFSGAKFSPETRFARANFDGQASFLDCIFLDEVDFSKARFCDKVDFTKAVFTRKAFFYDAKFGEKADFFDVTFSDDALFSGALFNEQVSFSLSKFLNAGNFEKSQFAAETEFRKVLFEQPKKVSFGHNDFSKFSFGDSDITRIKFGDRITWGGEDGLTIIEEQWLEQKTYRKNKVNARTKKLKKLIGKKQEEEKSTKENTLTAEILSFDKEKQKFAPATFEFVPIAKGGRAPYRYDWVFDDDGERSTKKILSSSIEKAGFYVIILIVTDSGGQIAYAKSKIEVKEPIPEVSLDLVLSVYRNLRENYESRLRYDEAGRFFIKEMELKRKFREVKSEKGTPRIAKNRWPRRNFFSLIGWYHLLSDYGESILKPFMTGAIVLALSTVFFSMQSNLILESFLPFFPSNNTTISTFAELERAVNTTHWFEAFERSLTDFLPLLSIGGDVSLGIIDYIIKIVGGILTFGLLAIALRRKFERKYTR